MNPIRDKLTYANVAATLAIAIAIVGGTGTFIAGGTVDVTANGKIRPYHVTGRTLAGINVVTASAHGGSKEAAAQCSDGDRLIGGGAQSNPSGGTAGGPQASYPNGNSWVVKTLPLTGASAVAYALCLKAKPGR